MKYPLLSLLTLCLTASFTSSAKAEVTAPVGYVKLTFNANADTPFSLPMNRAKAYAGKVASISGNVITIDSSDFTADQFVYAEGTQNEKYYVLFTTGPLEGRTFDVTANSANSVTVNQDGDSDIQSLINDPTATDLFDIRPHWTLNTLFPNGENLAVSTDFKVSDHVILARNSTDIGTRLSPTSSYFYYDSNDNFEGWYDNNDLSLTNVGATVLKNTSHYVFRNETNSDLVKNLVGDVPLTDKKIPIRTLSDNIEQDNYIAIPFPTAMTLDQAGFRQIPDFKSVTDFNILNGDFILGYNDNTGVLRPSPTASYFYYESGDEFEGWYDNNDLSRTNLGTEKIVKPGRAYIFRRSSDKFESNTFINPTIPYNAFTE